MYNYKKIRDTAINNPTRENLERLYNWLEQYDDGRGWNGEEWDCDDGYSLRPIYKEVAEDEWEIVDYELRKS